MASEMPVLPLVGSSTTWPGDELPLGLGRLDQRSRHPVLDGAGRVHHLELGVQPCATLVAEPRQLDERRRADRRDQVTGAGAEADNAQPPAIAGSTITVEPSGTAVCRPSPRRTSSFET